MCQNGRFGTTIATNCQRPKEQVLLKTNNKFGWVKTRSASWLETRKTTFFDVNRSLGGPVDTVEICDFSCGENKRDVDTVRLTRKNYFYTLLSCQRKGKRLSDSSQRWTSVPALIVVALGLGQLGDSLSF